MDTFYNKNFKEILLAICLNSLKNELKFEDEKLGFEFWFRVNREESEGNSLKGIIDKNVKNAKEVKKVKKGKNLVKKEKDLVKNKLIKIEKKNYGSFELDKILTIGSFRKRGEKGLECFIATV